MIGTLLLGLVQSSGPRIIKLALEPGYAWRAKMTVAMQIHGDQDTQAEVEEIKGKVLSVNEKGYQISYSRLLKFTVVGGATIPAPPNQQPIASIATVGFDGITFPKWSSVLGQSALWNRINEPKFPAEGSESSAIIPATAKSSSWAWRFAFQTATQYDGHSYDMWSVQALDAPGKENMDMRGFAYIEPATGLLWRLVFATQNIRALGGTDLCDAKVEYEVQEVGIEPIK